MHEQTLQILSCPTPLPTATSSTEITPTIVTRTCRQTFAGHRDFVLSVSYAELNSGLGAVLRDAGTSCASTSAVAATSTTNDTISTTSVEPDSKGIELVVSGGKDKIVVFWNAASTTGVNKNQSHTVEGPSDSTEDLVMRGAAQLVLHGHQNSG